MSSTFGSDPPIYAKPVRTAVGSSGTAAYSPSVTGSYNSQTATTHASHPEDEMQRPAIEKEIAELYFAVEKKACVEKEAKQLKMQHDQQLSSLRAMTLVQLNSG